MKIRNLLALFILISSLPAYGKSQILLDFEPVCDSLSVLLHERCGVENKLILKNVMKRGKSLDFYFTESLGDYPLRQSDISWFRKTLTKMLPAAYRGYKVDRIFSRRIDFDRLASPSLGYSGQPSLSKQRVKDAPRSNPLVRELGGQYFDKGLSGRHIALWHSHGRYYNLGEERWKWQRPFLFQTCEDLFTQSLVIPFLIPMLENAGACVLTPRERDTQTNEVIVDNDCPGTSPRVRGEMEITGKWTVMQGGFADNREYYLDGQNPFSKGTYLQLAVSDKKQDASVIWRPEIPQKGSYAVYVSYKSLPESTSSALYRIHHSGGCSDMLVNQKMGGGMWIYLGTYDFEEGKNSYVELSNCAPAGHAYERNKIVTADAVRFGGGMGNIARASADSLAVVSGLPRYCEGARYNLQWSGMDPEIYSPFEGADDYKDDFSCRGDWVAHISGGSRVNPKKKGRGIPVDLALGLHSDAGVYPNDSIVGTLAIYTSSSNGCMELPSGECRLTNREYADLVQSQVVEDIRSEFNPEWTRRQLWDRGYRESRTPSCPSMLLEFLSHQNFEDMKYALNPEFRFTVSRAIYKGMLKYLSNRYGCPYEVQPLPVAGMGIRFNNNSGTATLSWKAVKDRLEKTADAKGYILYTRVDDGSFDTGRIISSGEIKSSGDSTLSINLHIESGHIYSYRIVAFNNGGRSFPSETVSIGIPKRESKGKVLIVNNFYRVGAPSFFDGPFYAGFDNYTDSGVPYIEDLAFTGAMHEFHRMHGWLDDDTAGFGSSFRDYACSKVAGNTFDYALVHGKSLLKAGYAFYSCSNTAFISDSKYAGDAQILDLICGKQITTVTSKDRSRYKVFPEELICRLSEFAGKGGNLIVSGAYIVTDIFSDIYPALAADPAKTACRQKEAEFAASVLGYKTGSSNASRCGGLDSKTIRLSAGAHYYNSPNPEVYCVENVCGINPVCEAATTILRYRDTEISAGINYDGGSHKAVCYGFPIETVAEQSDRDALISSALDYFATGN